jgi:hypothetical protein
MNTPYEVQPSEMLLAMNSHDVTFQASKLSTPIFRNCNCMKLTF